jgi:hypothetical protein
MDILGHKTREGEKVRAYLLKSVVRDRLEHEKKVSE